MKESVRVGESEALGYPVEMSQMRAETRRAWPRYHEVISDHIENVHEISIVAEIGTAHGIWARHMLDHYENYIDKYFGIDVWERGHAPINDKKARSQFDVISRMWLVNMGPWLWDKAIPLRGTSHEWGRVFPHEIDLLHVDGGHEYDTVVQDFKLWFPLVSKGGLVLIDDVTYPDVARALDKFFGVGWKSFLNSNVDGDPARCAWVVK
jgi:hypothetical protein